jgi:hypothetical protein
VHPNRRRAAVVAVLAPLIGLAGTAVAVAAPARSPKPAVVSVRASKSVLAHLGGLVSITAIARHARRCEFSSRPVVHGVPVTVSCRTGRATRSVRLPANSGVANASYRFQVIATGPGGKSAARSVTIRVQPPAPTISLSAAPDGFASSGGTATVTALVSRSASCELSVTPALAGLPAAIPCAAGLVPVDVHRTFSLPALTGSSAQPYAFTLRANGAGGSATAVTTETVWPAMTFAAPAASGVSSFTGVSCPTATFCMATDATGGVDMYSGGHWSSQDLDFAGGVTLVSVSCVSPTFCMAVDNEDGDYGSGAWIWNGQDWNGGGIPGNYLTSVSCTSDTFCMALGNLNTGVFASLWNGKSWSSQTQVDSPAAYVQVSCASSTFCAAVDQNGDAITFDGTSWSQPDPIDPGVLQPLSTVSCPQTTFCTAMDGFGQAFTYNGASWSGPVGVENSAGVTSVSCTSPGFCVAADLTGDVVTEYGGVWSAPDDIDPQSNSNFYGFTGVSCGSVAFCVAVDDLGKLAVGTG